MFIDFNSELKLWKDNIYFIIYLWLINTLSDVADDVFNKKGKIYTNDKITIWAILKQKKSKNNLNSLFLI